MVPPNQNEQAPTMDEAAGGSAPAAGPPKTFHLPPPGALHVRPRVAPTVLTNAPTLLGLFQALRRRWLVALTLGLFCAAVVAGGVWVFQKTTYTARTLVHVYTTRPFILKNVPDNQSDFANHQRNQLALLRSRLVLNSALRNPKVASLPLIRDKVDPIAWLEKEIQADFNVAPEILRIALTGEDPTDLTPIVDAVRVAYVNDIVLKEHMQRSNRLTKLKLLSSEYG